MLLHSYKFKRHPNESDLRKFSQLYIVDNVGAIRLRSKSHLACSEDLLKQIDSIIRKSNPYVAAWKMMHEVESEEHNRCLSITSIPREVKMLFTRNDNFDKNRYNNATCNEVAVVFGSNYLTLFIDYHNENEQNIYLKDDCENEVIDKNLSTLLTAWFELNKI